jgi:hypothetical protein
VLPVSARPTVQVPAARPSRRVPSTFITVSWPKARRRCSSALPGHAGGDLVMIRPTHCCPPSFVEI